MNNRIDDYLKILRSDSNYYKVSRKLIGDNAEISLPEATYYAVWAPVIVSFVNWLIMDAVENGIKRLYFLARDAYPAYLAAKYLYDTEEIDFRYLRVSRQSLRVPEYHLLQEKCLDRIFISGIDVSLEKILKRANLTNDEIRYVASILKIDSDRILNRYEIYELKERLRDNKKLLDIIYEHSVKEYETTMSYLHENGLMDNVKYAVVDSGWVGTIQQSLARLVNSRKEGICLEGYYFGLYEVPKEAVKKCYHAFLFNNTSGVLKKVNFSNCLFETIYSEDSPMVVSYKAEGEKVTPVFSKTGALNREQHIQNIQYLMNWLNEYKQVRNEISRMSIGRYSSSCKENRINTNEYRITSRLLKKIMSAPDIEEAEYYGQYDFSDDLMDEVYRHLAPILKKEDIDNLRIVPKLLVMMGWSDVVLHESAWIEGTCTRMNKYKMAEMKRAKLLTVIRQQVLQICLKQ